MAASGSSENQTINIMRSQEPNDDVSLSLKNEGEGSSEDRPEVETGGDWQRLAVISILYYNVCTYIFLS